MNYIYSDVLKIPSEISDHDASVAFLQCPKSVSVSFKREVWLYDKVDKQKFIEKLEIVGFGKLITHVIYIIKLAEEGYPVNYF
jgi:hypothetical protein